MKTIYISNIVVLITVVFAGSLLLPKAHAQGTVQNSQKTYTAVFCGDSDTALTHCLNSYTQNGYHFEQAFYSALQGRDIVIFSQSK